jgi:hypothetical protein
MDIDTVFKIDFLKIKSIDFKKKKKLINKILEEYPEKRFKNFSSNRGNANFSLSFFNIFAEELNNICKNMDGVMQSGDVWSVSYRKGDYHVPHNHGSKGYCGILYLNMQKNSPVTSYIQPWNNYNGDSVIYEPKVEEGDIVIVPQFITHFTKPNNLKFKKRIISFDFKLDLPLYR